LPADQVHHNITYTREQLGLGPDEHISQLTLEFQKGYKGVQRDVAPGGLRAINTAYLEFSIVPGTRGEVENAYNVIGIDGNGNSFNQREDYPHRYDNSSPSDDFAGPRQAIVVDYEPTERPVGEVAIKLLEDVRGVVSLGKNRLQIELKNINTSLAPMTESLEAVALLSPGVKLHEQADPAFTDAKGNPTTAASYDIIDNDYNGSGRQLIKVIWQDQRLIRGQNLTAEFDVFIEEKAPSQLVFDVYGFSQEENIEVPSHTGGITDTVLQNDSENFYGKGTSHPRLKSANRYTVAGNYDIQTKKLIKGPMDDEYSKFTTAKYDETVAYKLLMTNTTGHDISMMTLIDVLPSIGDLGITDNIHRGSQFTPKLTGPIQIPNEWSNKVNVLYSTAKNPMRDDLTRYTDYFPNTPVLSNPAGAETPNWLSESEVTNWESIHSFKIELEEGDTWIKGQDIDINFSMKLPSETNMPKLAKNCDLMPEQRAAWNSYAVATDTGQPVEPERVGVAIECDPPDTPEIVKSVEDAEEFVQDQVKKALNQLFKFNVDMIVPEDLMGVEQMTIGDLLDENLEIVESETIVLVDGIQTQFPVDITGQLVKLTLDRNQLESIKGQVVTLQIGAKISSNVDIEIIDNQATIQVNDEPIEESNIVKVEPILGTLTIKKVDAKTDEWLEGAEFTLSACDEQSNCEDVIDTGQTGSNGELSFTNIELGEYALVELTAPEGYRLLTTPINIEINLEKLDETLEIVVQNSKHGWDLPDTGGPGTALFYGIGIILMLGASTYYFRKNKA